MSLAIGANNEQKNGADAKLAVLILSRYIFPVSNDFQQILKLSTLYQIDFRAEIWAVEQLNISYW